MKHYILCAAIHYDDGVVHHYQPIKIETGLVFCGYRHHCIFPQLPAGYQRDKLTQGFLTSWGWFVERKEAMKIATAAGQVESRDGSLFSEDLY